MGRGNLEAGSVGNPFEIGRDVTYLEVNIG